MHIMLLLFPISSCILSRGTVEVSLKLFLFFAKKLTSHSDHFLNLLKASVSVFLFSLSNVKAFGKLDETEISERSTLCQEALSDWIANKGVIGGSLFGGYVGRIYDIHAADEFKVPAVLYM